MEFVGRVIDKFTNSPVNIVNSASVNDLKKEIESLPKNIGDGSTLLSFKPVVGHQTFDVLTHYKSSVPIRPDEILQKPPTSFTQKVMSFEVSDISQISDIAGEANNELGSTNYKLPNNANICQSSLKFSQNQSNVVASEDQTIAKQIAAPILPQHIIGSTIGQSHCTPVMEVDKNSKLELVQCADLSVPVLWECLKRQDEKWNTLQEQIVRILEQKVVPCQPDPNMALVPKHDSHNPSELEVSQQASFKETPLSSSRNSYGNESRDNSQLLSCLHAQSDQIQKLHEQNQKLLEQNIKLLEEKQKLQEWNQELKCQLLLRNERISLSKLAEQVCPSEHPFIDKEMRSVSSEGRNEQSYTNTAHQQQTEAKKAYNSTKAKSNDIGSGDFREEKEIEKTSTSTMTSLIYDGSDKVVYQKLTTVTTDFKKQCHEISAQHSMNKEAMATPENSRPSPKDAASSSRRKKGKCRKCGKCSPHLMSVKDKSPQVNSLDAPGNGCRKVQKTSPERGVKTGRDALQNCEGKIEVHNADPEGVTFPRYENILRNVNELNLNCNEVDSTPRVKPFLKPSSKERKKYTPSPRGVDLSPKTENQRHSNRRKSSSTASNTSTDSVSSSPNCSIQELPFKEPESDTMIPGATTISTYGLSSPNLSKDTKRYLENFGLVRDRSDDNFKSRTTLVKRYLR